MAEVTLSHVRKVYPNGAVAVEDFNLAVRDREFLVLVGPSGCGKSTTLRMVAGLEEITSGTISIDGTVVNSLPPKDRDIAMVFQNYALYPHMTVKENMAFGLKLRHTPKAEIEHRIDEVAEVLGLKPYLSRLPKQLSGGQRQRVALGRAIVRQPKVFLFDEPLSNLDAKMRVEMREEIHRLHLRLDATILYVTHDQTEAMTLGDRIVVMENGHIRQVADPIRLYDDPENQFSAGFIGTPPMNMLAMTADGQGALMCAAGRLELPQAILPSLQQGQSILFGVRPEHLIRTVQTTPFENALRAEVDIVEQMGAEAYVHFSIAGVRMTARTKPDWNVRHGEVYYLQPELERICLFDPVTGVRIRP
ncbi:MAG: sn-glycerol-3-phosphate ABC transporter ATP-binding protein UgpC [Kiritimatiellae bacterium]|nr:sn-glycerol-3-phosphate ABC transporter ATP-binding protein UgpC [Kiritimatiellia bacterium]